MSLEVANMVHQSWVINGLEMWPGVALRADTLRVALSYMG